MAPVLTSPTNGSGYSCWTDLELTWTWSGPALAANEWFDVEFSKQGKNEWYGIGWFRETRGVVAAERAHDNYYRYCRAPVLEYFGSYEWKVRVIKGVQGSGKIEAVLSPDSQIWVFNYH